MTRLIQLFLCLGLQAGYASPMVIKQAQGINKTESRSFMPAAPGFQLWPTAVRVPYRVEPGFQDALTKMKEAVAHIEKNSCLRFKEVSGMPSGSFIDIKRGNDCNAKIGMKKTLGPHNLFLNPYCLNYHSNMMLHELLHTLGFDHEHNRPDRDEHVTVNERAENYDKHKWTEVGAGVLCHHKMLDYGLCVKEIYTKYLTYEMNSIMHYPPNDGIMTAKNGAKSFGVFTIPFGMTQMDKDKLNSFYGCPQAKFRTPAHKYCKEIEFKTVDGSAYDKVMKQFNLANYWDGIYKQDGTYVKAESDGLLYPVYRNVRNRKMWLARQKNAAGGRYTQWNFADKPTPGDPKGSIRIFPADGKNPLHPQSIVQYANWATRRWVHTRGFVNFKLTCKD